ncbi:MAG: DUF748 domain-containing protein [Candidatus Omnitrophica bacterium]|nr:DUF748 domain-containing protein [Candidatus Omnitrophota bacterium]
MGRIKNFIARHIKVWIELIIILTVIYIIIFCAAYIFLASYGKTIVVQNIEKTLNRKTSVGYIRPIPPFNLYVKGLDIQGIARVDSIFISPSIPSVFTGKLVLNKLRLKSPEFILERFASASVNGAEAQNTASISAATPSETPGIKPREAKPNKSALRFAIRRLKIKDGRINFTDHIQNGKEVKIHIKDLFLNATNIYLYSHPAITNFDLSARIPWSNIQEEGIITAEGWLNLYKKDIQATLRIENIDGIFFYPYYSNWVDLEKARIEKAKLNFVSNIHGLHNEVTAECRLELVDIVFRPRTADEEPQKAERIAFAILDIFKAANQDNIILDFTIHTAMDKPKFDFTDIKMAFESKLTKTRKETNIEATDVLKLPTKLIEALVKGTVDLSKVIIGSTLAVGNELKKSVEDTFKREKKEQSD